MKFILSIIIVVILGLSFTNAKIETSYLDTDSLSEILVKLGDSPRLDKYPRKQLDGISAEVGEAIVKYGFSAKPNGDKSKQQSKHFVCTSCHNVEKEDPDLAFLDPQDRLIYAKENGLPFLQGTTLYGAVNRESYYNGDYEKKYGALVEPARNDIREAIQLCATECAQGRALEEWELESLLAYLWTIDIKMGDLSLAGEEVDFINNVLNGQDESRSEAIELLESKYLKGSPATFTYPPDDRKKGYDLVGDPTNGELIYELSCMHCHDKQRYSYLHLDKHPLSLHHLRRNIGRYTRHSLYQVVRWGVPTKSGKRSYMPQYTQEKLSDQMVEDLRAYLEAS